MHLASVLRLSLALVALTCASGCFAQKLNTELFDRMLKERHIGTPEEAVVGVEVLNLLDDGRKIMQRVNGFVVRCDGFVLAPGSIVEPPPGIGDPKVEKKTYTVILHPGAEDEKRVPGLRTGILADERCFVPLRLKDFHGPALRAMLPDDLNAGDRANVYSADWDAALGEWQPALKREVGLADPAKVANAESRAGWICFARPLDRVVEGALVIGPEQMGIGMVVDAPKLDRREGFVSFAMLNRVTNCVSPVPCTDSEFAVRAASSATVPEPTPTAESVSNGRTCRAARGRTRRRRPAARDPRR